MISTIVIFLIVLGLLVFIHELGHFIVAKRSGMKVDEFGFGFPPRAFGIQRVNGKWKIVWGAKNQPTDDTIYSVNWIPLGGFVKIMGEDNDTAGDDRSFINKPFWPRFFTLSAGVIMNFILAVILLSVGYMAGLPVAVQNSSEIPSNGVLTERHVAIVLVGDSTPAQKAGLVVGDVIQSVDGQSYDTVENLQEYIKTHKGSKINLDVKRANEEKQFSVDSLANPPAGSGSVGVGLALYGKLRFGFLSAIGHGFETAYTQFIAIAVGFWHLITGGVGLSSLGGPIKIAQYTGQAADMGLVALIQFTAFLSLNLSLLNALPFPALDGGRIFFLIIETIRRKKNNPKIEQYANAVGFMVLLLLMLVISIHDVSQTQFIKHLFS